MKTTLPTTEAAHRLIDDENANWSRAGAYALVEYLEELEEDIGGTIEFCPVSIRCDYSQYDSLEDWADEQWQNNAEMIDALNLDSDEDDGNLILEAVREFIRDRGALIEFDGGIIVPSF